MIAFDLVKDIAGVLAALTAGAALGFLMHNFHPARIFMGDCGSNLLGLLLGAIAVPFLDTGFVVAKRLKYRRPVYRGDADHFHHRLARIGFSQRRTVVSLYAWTPAMAGLAVALRFVSYSENSGDLNLGWAVLMGALCLFAAAASVYLVCVLEILKLRRFRARHADPETSEHEIDARVERDLETSEFPRSAAAPRLRAPTAPLSRRARASTSDRRGCGRPHPCTCGDPHLRDGRVGWYGPRRSPFPVPT